MYKSMSRQKTLKEKSTKMQKLVLPSRFNPLIFNIFYETSTPIIKKVFSNYSHFIKEFSFMLQ